VNVLMVSTALALTSSMWAVRRGGVLACTDLIRLRLVRPGIAARLKVDAPMHAGNHDLEGGREFRARKS